MLAAWHMTPQVLERTMTDEQLSVLVPALHRRRLGDSVAHQVSLLLGGTSVPSGAERPSRGRSAPSGHTYGSPGAPLTGAALEQAVAAMVRHGDAGVAR